MSTYVIKTKMDNYLGENPANVVTPEVKNVWTDLKGASRIHGKRKFAERFLETWQAAYPNAGLHLRRVAKRKLTETEAHLLRTSKRESPVQRCTWEEWEIVEQLKVRGLVVIETDPSDGGQISYTTPKGLRVLKKYDREKLDGALVTVTNAYKDAKKVLEALPASRMRSLALTDLETSFTRAVFAAGDINDPIGVGG